MCLNSLVHVNVIRFTGDNSDITVNMRLPPYRRCKVGFQTFSTSCRGGYDDDERSDVRGERYVMHIERIEAGVARL